MIRHLVLASALKDIDSHFASLGVDYMPVKGTQFVAEECWQRLKTRTVSDIDILVNREDFNTVCGHFHNCENVAILHDRGFFSKSFKMGLGDSSVKLDISYQLNRPERFSLPTRDLFDRGIQVGGCRVLPTREDAALLAICDGKNALAQTFHKNQLLADIHVFMLSEAYDWDRFLRTARSTGIYPWICSVLSMYEKWSGVSLEKYSPPLRALVISRLLEIRKDWWPKWVKLLIFEVPFAAHPLRLLLAVPIDSIFRARRAVGRAGGARGFAAVELVRLGKVIRAAIWQRLSVGTGAFSMARQAIGPVESAFFNRRMRRVGKDFSVQHLSAKKPVDCLVATQNGLWVVYKSVAYQLSTGFCFGITRRGRSWLVYQQVGITGRVVECDVDLDTGRPKLVYGKTIMSAMSGGVHQISWDNGELWVADTFRNRILCRTESGTIRSIYPRGKAGSRRAANYCHFNSVLVEGNTVFALGNNCLGANARISQVFALDRATGDVQHVWDTGMVHAHNLVRRQKKLFVCASRDGSLWWGEKEFFRRSGHFVRGLDIAGDTIIVGGSRIAARSDRRDGDGHIWQLAADGEVKETMRLRGVGQIFEVRVFSSDSRQ